MEPMASVPARTDVSESAIGRLARCHSLKIRGVQFGEL
jgi:hypothetical protein